MSSGVHIFRFSLTNLFGAVLFVAFGVAAIRFASPLWAGLTMAVTVPILFAAVSAHYFASGKPGRFGPARRSAAGATCFWCWLRGSRPAWGNICRPHTC
jgi:hypothetical protein